MKTDAVYVLVAFVAVGMEMACVRGEERPGMCPKVPQGVFGSCVEMCSGDESCPQRMKCCSNGCGHISGTPIYPTCVRQALCWS
uniref:WAP domain-containing protein n=1 Tax=Panthera leo TaxID=9689 RepID=A0A8C9DBU0_PANLE